MPFMPSTPGIDKGVKGKSVKTKIYSTFVHLPVVQPHIQ